MKKRVFLFSTLCILVIFSIGCQLLEKSVGTDYFSTVNEPDFGSTDLIFGALIAGGVAIITTQTGLISETRDTTDNDRGVAASTTLTTVDVSGALVHNNGSSSSTIISKGTRYGLIVGINNYAPAYAMNELAFCTNDATGVKDSIIKDVLRWNSGYITFLTNSNATKANIQQKLKEFSQHAVSGDIVFYFQASHGDQVSGTETYLATYDSDFHDYELAEELNSFAEGVKVIVVVDACFSGGLFSGNYKSSFKPDNWKFAENVVREFRRLRVRKFQKIQNKFHKKNSGPEIGFITSCALTTCGEFPHHGIFSGHFIQGFRDGDSNSDGALTFMELYEYAQPKADDDEQKTQKFNDSILSSTIAAASLAPFSVDKYESDNMFSSAKTILPGETQLHSLNISGDEDYITFTLSGVSNVKIETSGNEADTELFLYDEHQKQIAYNGDIDFQSGFLSGNYFSKIEYAYLPAGKYYAHVKAEGTDSAIESYWLTLTVIQ